MDLNLIRCIWGIDEMMGEKLYQLYVDRLLGTLEDARPPEYFVAWEKVLKNVRRYEPELNLLRYVFAPSVSEDERERRLREVWSKWPEKERLFQALLLLLAIRIKKGEPIRIRLTDGIFSVTPEDADTVVRFARETGLLFHLVVEDIPSYALGVEVGMDTNARKNRSGEMFERFVCGPLLKRYFPESKGFKVVWQDEQLNLWKEISRSKKKKHDFVVYKGSAPVLVVECTFIGTAGSKPTAIAESYPKLSKLARASGIRFMWLIDGWGWRKQRGDLLSAVKEIDIILSPRLLEDAFELECLNF